MPRRLSLLPLASMTVLAACSHHRVAIVTPPAVPAVVMVDAPPVARPSPINSNLSTAATVWHLRAALNVAALACRGTDEAAIIAGYNLLLKTQKAAFATAQAGLSDEYKAGGGDWQDRYDDAMTRLYNFFSQAPARDRFCVVATGILADSASVLPDQFTAFASDRLPMLDAPFAALLAPGTAMPTPAMASTPLPVRQPVTRRPAIALVAAASPRPAPAAGSSGNPARPALSLNLAALPGD
jgi:hypothetical protein